MKPFNPSYFSRILVLLFILTSTACLETVLQDEEGHVTHVSDGDSFEMRLTQSRTLQRVRLYGIDAPEKGQAFSHKARDFTRKLIEGKTIRVEIIEEDRFGRIVGDAFLPDGRHINQVIVEAGYAWWFQRYAPHDQDLAALEADARQNRRGLWQQKKPTPPWVFRSQNRR